MSLIWQDAIEGLARVRSQVTLIKTLIIIIIVESFIPNTCFDNVTHNRS